jgi:hypothetical protein
LPFGPPGTEKHCFGGTPRVGLVLQQRMEAHRRRTPPDIVKTFGIRKSFHRIRVKVFLIRKLFIIIDAVFCGRARRCACDRLEH